MSCLSNCLFALKNVCCYFFHSPLSVYSSSPYTQYTACIIAHANQVSAQLSCIALLLSITFHSPSYSFFSALTHLIFSHLLQTILLLEHYLAWFSVTLWGARKASSAHYTRFVPPSTALVHVLGYNLCTVKALIPKSSWKKALRCNRTRRRHTNWPRSNWTRTRSVKSGLLAGSLCEGFACFRLLLHWRRRRRRRWRFDEER